MEDSRISIYSSQRRNIKVRSKWRAVTHSPALTLHRTALNTLEKPLDQGQSGALHHQDLKQGPFFSSSSHVDLSLFLAPKAGRQKLLRLHTSSAFLVSCSQILTASSHRLHLWSSVRYHFTPLTCKVCFECVALNQSQHREENKNTAEVCNRWQELIQTEKWSWCQFYSLLNPKACSNHFFSVYLNTLFCMLVSFHFAFTKDFGIKV